MKSSPLNLFSVAVLITSLLCFLTVVSGHDREVVHPALSNNTIDTLNHPLITRFKDSIRQGSYDEDNYPRPCYHAYDPINGEGWCPIGCIRRPRDFCSTARAEAPVLWNSALTSYQAGKFDEAFHFLGRSMHLLQDMTSPAHVHLDVHIDIPELDLGPFEGTDDFEAWGPANFKTVSGVQPFIPGDGSVSSFIHDMAIFTYSQTTYPGVIVERNPQSTSTFRDMFPTLTYNDGGILGDAYWHINNVGDFGNFPNLGRLDQTDDWWPSVDDFTEDNGGLGGVRRISGNFYIENSAGDNGQLTPAKWHGNSNTKTLLRLYGDALYPETVKYCTGFLKKFAETVCAPPVADFTANPISGCGPLTVQFSDLSLGDYLTSWFWDFGDASTSNQRNPSHTYTVQGSYSVSLTVNSDCGKHTKTKARFITVRAPASANFGATPRSGCFPLPVQFTDQSIGDGLNSWLWNFGDGGTSNQRGPSHTYTNPGVYTVTLTVTGTCGQDSEVKQSFITVNSPVIAHFTATPRTDCAPLSVQFTDTSTGTGINSWQWDFGDGSTSNQQNPSHVYTSPGKYTVAVTVGSSCGTDNETKTDFIVATSQPPIASFAANVTSGCEPLAVQFSDSSVGNGPLAWKWDFGDGSTNQSQNPTHTYATHGLYTVTLTVTDKCGQDTETKINYITVKAAPAAAFSVEAREVCVGRPVCFSDQSTGETLKAWLWNFGDGKTSDEQNPCHAYDTPGTYAVSVRVTGECGVDTLNKDNYITVHTAPIAKFSFQPTEGCAPLSVAFKDESTLKPTAWKWDFGDGAPPNTEQHPNHTYQEPGSYVVVLKASNNCGEDSTQQQVIVCGPPLADLSIPTTSGCAPLEFCISKRSTQCSTGAWELDCGTGPIIWPEDTHCCVFNNPGSYLVRVRLRTDCGIDEATIEVHVLPPHIVDFIAQSLIICPGESVCFADQSKGDNLHDWVWDFGDGTSSQERNPCHVYQHPGSYTICLTVTGACGPVKQCKETLVREPVTTTFSFSPEAGCGPLEVQFTDESTGHEILSWEWDFGDGSPINTEQNPKHMYQEAGRYSVTLKVTNGCGPATASKDILVQGPPSPPTEILTVPEAKEGELITLHWTEVDGATKYFVEARVIDITDSIPVCEVLASETSCEVCLDTSGIWQFSVSTESACGRGSPRESGTVEVLPAALIVYWPLDNCTAKAVLEGCADSIDPKEQDGVILGRVACELDRFTRERSALRFDGFGHVNGTDLPDNVNDFSLETWVRPATCVSNDHGGGFVLDNGDAGTSSTGTWKESEAANPYGASSLFSNEPGASYTFATAISGLYEVSIWWTTTSKRCEQVPIQLFDGNTPLETIYVNQRAGGGSWHTLNVYTFTSKATVTISSIGECSTSADAVRFARVDGPDSADAVTIVKLYPTQDRPGAPVHFGWSPDKNSFSFASTSGSLEASEFLTEEWHHLLATRKDELISLYVDGEIAGETAGDLTVLGNSFSFGGSENQGEFCGSLDAIRYTRESTPGSKSIDLILAGGPSAYLFPREPGKGTIRIGTRTDAVTMRWRTSPLQSNEAFELSGLRIVALDLTESDASSLPSPLEYLELGEVTLRDADGEHLLGKLAKGLLAQRRLEFNLEPSPNSSIPSNADLELAASFFLKSEAPPGTSLQFIVESCDNIQLSTGNVKAYVAGRRRIGKPAVEGDVLTVSVCDPLLFGDCPPEGKELVPYDATLTASGGYGAYTWRIVDGTLPQGLSLDGNRIFGTPAAGTTGNYSVCFEVSDSCPSGNQSLVQCCTIEIERPEEGHLDLVKGKATRKGSKPVWTFSMGGTLETNFQFYRTTCTGGNEIMAVLSWEGQPGLKYFEFPNRKIKFKPRHSSPVSKITLTQRGSKLILDFAKREFTLKLARVSDFNPFATSMDVELLTVAIPIDGITIEMKMQFAFTGSSKKLNLLPAEERRTTQRTMQSNLCTQ